MNRKPHPSSVLKNLPEEDQAALYQFLMGGKTLAEGVAWVFSNNGVRTNDSSLSDWRGWYEIRRRINGWNADLEQFKDLLAGTKIDPGVITSLGEAVFLSKAMNEGDVKTYATIAGIMQRQSELESSQKAHADKMQLESRKLKRKDKALEQAQQKIDQYERKIAALEAEAKAAAALAQKTKDALVSGGMTEEVRKSLIAEMDHQLLGKPKPAAEKKPL